MNEELKKSYIEFLLKIGGSDKFSYLDNKMVLWKIVDGQLIGKPAVKIDDYTYGWGD